jgi:hypothetical protein
MVAKVDVGTIGGVYYLGSRLGSEKAFLCEASLVNDTLL